MKTAKQIGNIGEDIAEKYLRRKGFRILSRNYSVRGGEIDIIAYKAGVLVYCEVKSRTSDEFGTPASAVDGEKIKNIKHTSRAFLSAYRKGGKIPVFYPFGIRAMRRIRKQRIDIIEVYLTRDCKPIKINHIKDRESWL